MGIHQALMGAGGAGWQSIGGTLTGNGVNAGVYMSIQTSGVISLYASGILTTQNYYLPNANTPSGLSVKFDYVSGDALDSGTDWFQTSGAWVSLGGGQNIGFASGTSLGRLAVYTVSFSTDGGSTTATSGNFTFDN